MTTLDRDTYIRNLESQNRMLRHLCRLTGVCALLLAGNLLVGWQQGVSDVIRTRRLEVLNGLDKPVVMLEAVPKRGGQISVQNTEGTDVFGVAATEQQNVFLFASDRFGNRLMSFEGSPGLCNFDLSNGMSIPLHKPWQIRLGSQTGKSGADQFGILLGDANSSSMLMALNADRVPQIIFSKGKTITSSWSRGLQGDVISFWPQNQSESSSDGLYLNVPEGHIYLQKNKKTETWPPSPVAGKKKS